MEKDEDFEARVRAQIVEAAQVGFAAQYAAKYQEPSRRWRDLEASRREALIKAAELVRTSYLTGKLSPRTHDEAFAACNRHLVLGVTHVFVGAVIGYYKDCGL